MRAFCRAHGIVYQGFSLLTANRARARHAARAADRRARRPDASRSSCSASRCDVGMLPLTGTTDAAHMRQDLDALLLPPLDPGDVRAIESISSNM